MRTPDFVLEQWEKEFGLRADDMRKYFPAVERMLHSKPVPSELQGSISQVLQKERPHALARAEVGCDGQGYCILGCPTGAKRSTDVSYMAEAMKNNTFLFTHYRVEEIITEQGRAAGVRARLPGYGDMFEVIIRAKKVVLAAGALQTPLLLSKLPGLKNPNIGKHLSIHPAINIGARLPTRVREKLCVPQSTGIFYGGKKAYNHEGYTLQGDALPLAFPLLGRELKKMMDGLQQVTNYAAMTIDPSLGRLLFIGDRAVPYYPVDGKLKAILEESTKAIATMFFEAGALEVYCPIAGLERVTSRDGLADLGKVKRPGYHYTLSAHHPLGTCRMGKGPADSVVDKDGEVWGVRDLYVADGSAVPGPIAANPQVTIMANALRIADRLHEELA
jgi:hypothetical protein